MKKLLPYSLVFLRLLLGFYFVLHAYLAWENYALTGIICLILGLLSDILDGIAARKLGVSSPGFRRLDSNIDQVFYFSMLAGMFLHSSFFFQDNWLQITFLVSSEIAIYMVSYIRFRKEVATHSWGAKLWSLSLVATFIDVILNDSSFTLFQICFWLGLVSRLEIVAILLSLEEWTSDVPTFYHALQLRKGKDIKRSKWLNG